MRFLGLAVVTSAALMLSACKGGTDHTNDSANAANAAANPAVTTPAAGAAGAVAMKPITGQTVTIKMIGDDKGYHFDPAETTIKQGDGIKFIMVSGGPHNVAFDATNMAPAAKAQLTANMGPDAVSELSSKYLQAPNEEYVVSFGGVPAGTYDINCTPHLAMNMRGKIIVQ